MSGLGVNLGLTPLSINPDSGARNSSPSPRGSGERVPEGRVRGLLQGPTKGERLANLLSESQ
jgi:hypothetical protein